MCGPDAQKGTTPDNFADRLWGGVAGPGGHASYR
jgi:hypothetical protein